MEPLKVTFLKTKQKKRKKAQTKPNHIWAGKMAEREDGPWQVVSSDLHLRANAYAHSCPNHKR